MSVVGVLSLHARLLSPLFKFLLICASALIVPAALDGVKWEKRRRINRIGNPIVSRPNFMLATHYLNFNH